MTTEQEALEYAKLLSVLIEWNAENYIYVQSLVALGNKQASEYVKEKNIDVDAVSNKRGYAEDIRNLTTELLSTYVKYCEKENLNLESHTTPILKTLGLDANPKIALKGNDAYSRSKCISERVDAYSDIVDRELKTLREISKDSQFTNLLKDIENLQIKLELYPMSLVNKVEKARDEGRQ